MMSQFQLLIIVNLKINLLMISNCHEPASGLARAFGAAVLARPLILINRGAADPGAQTAPFAEATKTCQHLLSLSLSLLPLQPFQRIDIIIGIKSSEQRPNQIVCSYA